MCSQQPQSLTWRCACHLLLALHFDNHPGRGKRQAVQQGSSPGYSYFTGLPSLHSALSFALSCAHNSCFMNSPTPPFVHCCSASLVSEPFLFTFSHSLSVSVPSRLSPGATAFTWPLHVTRSPAKTPRMPRSGPPLFPTLLNFRQKKRKRRERRRWV